jgi:hypothetical protein
VAQRDFVRGGLALIDGVDTCAGRATPAFRDHRDDLILRSAQQRLDRTIVAVAYPALNAALERRDFHPGAVADALHATADNDVPI